MLLEKERVCGPRVGHEAAGSNFRVAAAFAVSTKSFPDDPETHKIEVCDGAEH